MGPEKIIEYIPNSDMQKAKNDILKYKNNVKAQEPEIHCVYNNQILQKIEFQISKGYFMCSLTKNPILHDTVPTAKYFTYDIKNISNVLKFGMF